MSLHGGQRRAKQLVEHRVLAEEVGTKQVLAGRRVHEQLVDAAEQDLRWDKARIRLAVTTAQRWRCMPSLHHRWEAPSAGVQRSNTGLCWELFALGLHDVGYERSAFQVQKDVATLPQRKHLQTSGRTAGTERQAGR